MLVIVLIILAPYVAGACGVGACIMVSIRLVVSGSGHIELNIYIYIWDYVYLLGVMSVLGSLLGIFGPTLEYG